MMVSLMLAEGVGALVIAYYIVKTFFATNTLPLPPGPKGLPILGNVSDLPRNDGKHEWQHWLKFKDGYGLISSIAVFGQPIILMHDLEATLELRDRRGAKYSSRGRQVFAGELCVRNDRNSDINEADSVGQLRVQWAYALSIV
jgi:hypothetical protein